MNPARVEALNLPRLAILGAPVHVVTMADVIRIMERWIECGQAGRWIAVTNMHGIMESHHKPDFNAVLKSADLSIPDGYRVTRIARLCGFPVASQVTGPDLLHAFCAVAGRRGYRLYFYGDTQDVLDLLVGRLSREFPSLAIAGAYSPPFRPLAEDEEAEIVARINEARPDVRWVGLGLPKQEYWIYRNRGRLRAPVSVAVGAAFKFLSGRLPRAPGWMTAHGLEWLWRFAHEPRRLFQRVAVYGPEFLWKTALEMRGIRRFD